MIKLTDNSITLSQKISGFIAKAESDHQTFESHDFSHHFEEKESRLNKILNHISDEITHLKECMTPAANKQWHKNTQQILQDNQNEMISINSLCHETHTHITAQCDRLNQATMSTVKNAAQFFVSVKNNSLQKLADNKYQELEKTCEKNLSRVKNTVRSLGWKNLATTFCLSILVSIIVSLYINNESPWAAHNQVVQQRDAGKALLASWTHLSPNDRTIVIQSA